MTGAALALLLLWPLLLAVAVVLRFTGEGDVLFRQRRIGFKNRPFQVWKFVTMVRNSEALGTITAGEDPRILPVGRFLRKTKINELPQLLNVLVGDMSLVGPRPQTEECFALFPGRVRKRIYDCRPGVTGLGSLAFRDEGAILARSEDVRATYRDAIMPLKGDLELWYQEHRSPWQDLKIMLLTIVTLVRPRSDLCRLACRDLPRELWPGALAGDGRVRGAPGLRDP